MARYNREFLVPYLHNICALHLAEAKLENRYAWLNSKASELSHREDNPKPERPKPQGPSMGTYMLILLAPCMWALTVFIFREIKSSEDPFLLMALFFLAIAVLMTVGVVKGFLKATKGHEEDVIYYEKALARWEQVEKRNAAQVQKAIPYENEMKRCEQEIYRVEGILQRVYGANIIPSKYRGLYPAVYLYDWFSTSQADDLDHALAMYVLEEIKSRLDRIIDNQSEMILNQRIMMANQQKSIQQQRSYENMMRTKLNQMHATQEEHLAYTRMIESNTAATAFFAAADYFRNI